MNGTVTLPCKAVGVKAPAGFGLQKEDSPEGLSLSHCGEDFSEQKQIGTVASHLVSSEIIEGVPGPTCAVHSLIASAVFSPALNQRR